MEAYRSGHNGPHSKCGNGVTRSWVRIPPLPPRKRHIHLGMSFSLTDVAYGGIRTGGYRQINLNLIAQKNLPTNNPANCLPPRRDSNIYVAERIPPLPPKLKHTLRCVFLCYDLLPRTLSPVARTNKFFCKIHCIHFSKTAT